MEGVQRSAELLGDADKENVVAGAKPTYMTSTASSRKKDSTAYASTARPLLQPTIAEEPAADAAAAGCVPARLRFLERRVQLHAVRVRLPCSARAARRSPG